MKSNTRIGFVPVEIGATPKVRDQFVWNLVLGINNVVKYGDCSKIREIRCLEPEIWAKKQQIKDGATSAMFRVKIHFCHKLSRLLLKTGPNDFL